MAWHLTDDGKWVNDDQGAEGSFPGTAGNGSGNAPPGNYPGGYPDPWQGLPGQGYYDPKTGQTYDQQHAPPGSVPLDRRGLDKVLQGHLEDPYAGNVGDAPGIAESEEARLQGKADAARNVAGPQINNAQYLADRDLSARSQDAQQYGANQFYNLISGASPSIAQQQLRQGYQQSADAATSLANSARGGGSNLAAAARQAADTRAGLLAQTNQQSQALRGQEVAAGLAGYGNAATQMRGDAFGQQQVSAQQATRQAGLEQQQHGLNAQTSLGYEGLKQGMYGMQQQGSEYNESENQQAQAGGEALGVQQSAVSQNQRNAWISGLTQLGGSAVSGVASASSKKDQSDGSDPNNPYSDRRLKRDIQAASDRQLEASFKALVQGGARG